MLNSLLISKQFLRSTMNTLSSSRTKFEKRSSGIQVSVLPFATTCSVRHEKYSGVCFLTSSEQIQELPMKFVTAVQGHESTWVDSRQSNLQEGRIYIFIHAQSSSSRAFRWVSPPLIVHTEARSSRCRCHVYTPGAPVSLFAHELCPLQIKRIDC